MGLWDDDDEKPGKNKKEEKTYTLKELKKLASVLREIVGSGKKKSAWIRSSRWLFWPRIL